MPEVLGYDYRPKRIGRPPNVNIDRFKEVVEANPGQWVAETYSENNAASARRQFQALGYQVMTAKAKAKGKRVVMVRVLGDDEA
jgi:hypothetical protein